MNCQELENLYENSRHDLQVTQEALTKFQSSQQVNRHLGQVDPLQQKVEGHPGYIEGLYNTILSFHALYGFLGTQLKKVK